VEEKIICMHGGLSPSLTKLEQLRNIKRPTEVPDEGLLCDVLWSDPDPDAKGWGESDRGVSFTFGADVVAKFLQRTDLDLVCRAHQVVEDGYEFFAQRQLVTIFSAPNYCGEFDNSGAMMSVDENLMCSFQVLKPASKSECSSYLHPRLRWTCQAHFDPRCSPKPRATISRCRSTSQSCTEHSQIRWDGRSSNACQRM